MDLRHYFDQTYRPLRLRGRSANTTRLYHCTIRSLARFLERTPTLDDLADELTLARFLEHRQQTRSPYTAERERSALMAMARLAADRRLIPVMPLCEPCVLPDRIPAAWSEDELRRLYAAAGAVHGHVGVVPAGEWWTALIDVAFQSGERIGAIMATPARGWRRPHLEFDAVTRKGGRRGRVAQVSPDVADRLDAMIALRDAGPDDPLFAWDRSRTYLWDRLRAILLRAGLTGRRLGFQQVRRSAVSHVARAGGDPVAMAGHAQAATTRRWYLDPRYAQRGARPCDLLPRLGSG